MMQRILLSLLCFNVICCMEALGQFSNITIDTVGSFLPGTLQYSGQGPAFFPMNIFGLPDSTARDSVPSTNPRQVLSIGLNGVISVGFKNHVIIDGPGPDFTIFENAFIYGRGRVYSEPGRIAVSKDGIEWTEFPYDPVTFVGCAGVTPTSGSDPFVPGESGGNSFDLSDIGVDSIRWIRITDITQQILSNPQSPLYDPTLSGFDLDAITTWHAVQKPFRTSMVEVLPGGTARVYASKPGTLLVSDISGKMIEEIAVEVGVFDYSLSAYTRGAVLYTLVSGNEVFTLKLLK